MVCEAFVSLAPLALFDVGRAPGAIALPDPPLRRARLDGRAAAARLQDARLVVRAPPVRDRDLAASSAATACMAGRERRRGGRRVHSRFLRCALSRAQDLLGPPALAGDASR